MKVNEAINKGLELIRSDKDLSKGTYIYYKSHFNHFKRYLESESISDMDLVNKELIESYVKLQEATCKGITINKRIKAVKKLLSILNMDCEFIKDIKRYKEVKTTFEMVELDDVKRIRKEIMAYPDDIDNNLLHKCFLILLSETGVRRTELLLIEKKDVDFERCEIKLQSHTKSKEVRTVFFDIESKATLLKMYNSQNNHKWLLNNSRNNKPATYRALDTFIVRLKRDFQIDLLHPHMFRHFFITTWLNNGATLKEAQELSGIKTLSVLERYWHMTKDIVKKSYNDRFLATLRD